MTGCSHAVRLERFPDGAIVECSAGIETLPSERYCRTCQHYSGPPRGAGDVIHALTTATGIAQAVKAVSKATGRDCGCGRRRATLNAALPLTKPHNP